MSDVLNLNRFRKRKQQTSEREQAERNRVVHGRTKADKQLARLERERAEQALEGHRIVALASTVDDESLDGLASDDGEDESLPEPE